MEVVKDGIHLCEDTSNVDWANHSSLQNHILDIFLVYRTRHFDVQTIVLITHQSITEIKQILDIFVAIGILGVDSQSRYYLLSEVSLSIPDCNNRVLNEDIANYQLEETENSVDELFNKYRSIKLSRLDNAYSFYDSQKCKSIYENPSFYHKIALDVTAPNDTIIKRSNDNNHFYVQLSSKTSRISCKLMKRNNTHVNVYTTYNKQPFGDCYDNHSFVDGSTSQ